MKKSYIVFVLFLIMFPSTIFARPSVALVLSGGGARGYVHIATIKMIEKYNIPVDYVVGTSMGAIIGGLYAAGYTSDEMIKAINENNVGNAVFNFNTESPLPLPRDNNELPINISVALDSSGVLNSTGLVDDTKILNMLNKLLINVSTIRNFDDLPRSFRAVSVDVVTGDTVAMKDGSLVESIRSSMGIPYAFPVFEKDGSFFVDGGVKNNMPVDIAKAEFHPDIIISSDCTSSEALLERGGGISEKLRDRTASFSDVINQVTSLGDAYAYSIDGIKNLSDLTVFYDTTAWSTASFGSANNIIESAENQILPYEGEFKALSETFSEEDKLNSNKASYFSFDAPVVDTVVIDGYDRYRKGTSEIFEKEFISFKGQKLTGKAINRLEKKIVSLSEYYGTSYMYYDVNETDDGVELSIKYDFPILKKNQLSIMAEGLFSFGREGRASLGNDLTFSFILSGLLKYNYVLDPLNSLDSLTFSLFLKSPLKNIEFDFYYTHVFNVSSSFMGFLSPYLVFASKRGGSLSHLEKTFFKERDYSLETGLKIGYFNELSVLTTTIGLFYTHFGETVDNNGTLRRDKREHSLLPYLGFDIYVGDKRDKAVYFDTTYRVDATGFVGFDIPCFSGDFAIDSLRVPYSFEVKATGTYKFNTHVIGKLDGRFGFSTRSYDVDESYFNYGGVSGMPGFYAEDKYLDYVYSSATLLFPFLKNPSVVNPAFALKLAVGAHDVNSLKPTLSYDENARIPFSSLSKVNVGLDASFVLSTSIIDVILSFGYEFMENRFSLNIELW